jgi:hypothetical protein
MRNISALEALIDRIRLRLSELLGIDAHRGAVHLA